MTAASTSGVDLPLSTPTSDDSPTPIPADAAALRQRRWGCGILLGLALATPVILLVGGYVAIVWSSDRLAKDAIARARAAGDPVNSADMEAFYANSPAIEEATGHWIRATRIVGDPAFNATTRGIPLFDGARPSGDEVLLPGDLPNVKAFLDRHREVVDEAHAARRAGSVARFPLKMNDGLAMLLPHVQDLRGVNRLLELELEVRLAEGDHERAVEALLSMVATSEALTDEPILVSQLVRIACLGTAASALERTLQRHDLTDERLARLQEAFARQRFDRSLKRAYQGEQFFAIHTMQADVPMPNAEMEWQHRLPFRGADLAKTLELWRPVIDASDEGLLEAHAAAKTMRDEIDATADSSFDRLRFPMTMLLLPAIDAGAKAFLRAEATARLAETAIACERYRVARGDYPAKLNDLVPEFLPILPADPCDRQPLRYVVSESGATLYSIGANLTDEGGLNDPVDGDLTFELKAEKSETETSTAEVAP